MTRTYDPKRGVCCMVSTVLLTCCHLVFLKLVDETRNGRPPNVPAHQDPVLERKVSWAHSYCKENVRKIDLTHRANSKSGHDLKHVMYLYLSLLSRSLSSLKPRLSSISLKGQAKVYIKIC